MRLNILYRGPLSSCNYGCPYCPFAKHAETRAEHAADAAALERFCAWAAKQRDLTLGIFFTPWGEALIRRRYQEAFVTLTALPHVAKVAIQTNLAAPLRWIERCDPAKVGLWATFHPGETELARFVRRCHEARALGARLSVGVVGLKEHQAAIAALRAAIPADTYVWINAYKREPDYYAAEHLAAFTAIDPLFPINNQRHPSQGLPCDAGHTAIAVDGAGTMRRCHFIKAPIGNIYDADWRQALSPRLCENATCGCHIGYVHLPHLGLGKVFGDGLLERIPVEPLWR